MGNFLKFRTLTRDFLRNNNVKTAPQHQKFLDGQISIYVDSGHFDQFMKDPSYGFISVKLLLLSHSQIGIMLFSNETDQSPLADVLTDYYISLINGTQFTEPKDIYHNYVIENGSTKEIEAYKYVLDKLLDRNEISLKK